MCAFVGLVGLVGLVGCLFGLFGRFGVYLFGVGGFVEFVGRCC